MVDEARLFPWRQGQVLPDEAVQGLGLVGAGTVELHQGTLLRFRKALRSWR